MAGCVQLCAGQEAGGEADVRAMAKFFEDANTEAAMLVDATNAFNLLNRRAALINIHVTCPSIATVLTNMYRGDGNLYIQGQVLKSKEGVMQGDPLAMSMYALGILPLIRKLKATKQVWFTDDAAAGGSLVNLHEWWTALLRQGPSFGYHPNPAKTWLIIKEGNLDQATNIFGSSGVNICISGYLLVLSHIRRALLRMPCITLVIAFWDGGENGAGCTNPYSRRTMEAIQSPRS